MKPERAFVAQEEAVDCLLGLEPQDAGDLLLAEDPLLEQDLAEQGLHVDVLAEVDLGLLLALEGAPEVLLGDPGVGEQELAEVAPRVGRGRRDDLAVLEVQRGRVVGRLDEQDPGLAGGMDPLQEVRERHRAQRSGERHGVRVRGRRRARPGQRPVRRSSLDIIARARRRRECVLHRGSPAATSGSAPPRRSRGVRRSGELVVGVGAARVVLDVGGLEDLEDEVVEAHPGGPRLGREVGEIGEAGDGVDLEHEGRAVGGHDGVDRARSRGSRARGGR